MQETKIAYIALGGNIGDREEMLAQALTKIGTHMTIKNRSSIYETSPVGYSEQGNFLNMVIEVQTILTPEELFEILVEIENSLGKDRTIHQGPRVIDLDILLYEDAEIDTVRLCIPHKEMFKRKFVLLPLAEIAPDLIAPGKRKTIKEKLNKLTTSEVITIWTKKK